MCPNTYKAYLLAMLLLEVSKKNNTNGQFSAFYKNSNKIGHYGGEKEIDLNRITSRIILEMHNFDEESLLDKLYVSRMDTNEWIKMICGDGRDGGDGGDGRDGGDGGDGGDGVMNIVYYDHHTTSSL